MNILDCIGNTPLVYLAKISAKCGANIYVKLENRNSGFSIKDRLALSIINEAIKRGELKKDGYLIEATSGNTGIALTVIGNYLGYKTILTMPESMSLERRKLLAMLGAELVLTPAAEGMNGAKSAALALLKKHENSFYVDQFANKDGILAHYNGTAVEILNDFAKQKLENPALFVSAVGTGTTLTGIGRRLKENIPNIKVIAVEPEESPLLSKGQAGPHKIQGIGANFIPTVLDRNVYDEICLVSSNEALLTAKMLMREEAISGGISSGANICAAMKLAQKFPNKNIVTIICDSAERYLSTDLGICE